MATDAADPAKEGGTAMPSLQRSIVFSAIERYASLVLFFLVTAVLSRLLTPREVGTYAVVNAICAVIIASFQEFGGGNYLIQKHELSSASVRTAFSITLGISALIGIALFALAGALSRFFDQDNLTVAIHVIVLNFFITPFSGTLAALFRRNMEFGKLAICSIASGVGGAVVSITLALLHFSYMAPIWGMIAGNVLTTIMLIAMHGDLGAFRPSLREYRDVISFGLYASGVSVINVFYNLSPQLFMARILDFASVGLYSRAINITQVFDRLVTNVLGPVILPAIVAQNKAGGDLKVIYLEAIQLLSAVQWPFLIFIAIMARPMILIWLGQTWLEVVPLVRILCVANLALFAACLTYPLFVAVGSVRDALVSSLISLPPSLLLILCASFFGIQAVAGAALLTLPFQAAVAIHFIGRHLDIGLEEFVRTLTKSGLVTVMTASGIAGCAVLIETGMVTPFLGLISASCAAALCWSLALVVTGHPLLHRLVDAAASLAVIAPGFGLASSIVTLLDNRRCKAWRSKMPIGKDVKLGRDVRIFHPELVNLYGCSIGDETRIGTFVEVQNGANIGARCKISSHSFICEGVTIEDEVFIGHGVMFTNDKYPRAIRSDGRPQGPADWTVEPTRVGRGASIGSNATILCGVTIGAWAIVGAGAVVTRDVAPRATVAGVPARVIPPSETRPLESARFTG
jgi:O-antigen/teichoic acid export membrane protein/acetyltransferase-like isoleucine patch superfamily enzyme